MLPDFRLLYKARVIKSMALAQKQTQKSMEQNRQPRSKPCNDGQLIYNKAGKNTCRKKKTRTQMLTAAKTWEQPKCPPADGWSSRLDSGYYPTSEKNRTLPFATWMDLAGTLLSQSGERQILYVITYIWNLKINHMNITKQKETRKYREQTGGYQWGEMKEEGQDAGRG